MKATGIVRKMDELGRIVLPIELRNRLEIGPKDPIEIFTDGDSIVLGGIIETRKNKTTKNKTQMAFVTIEDSYGSIEMIVFPKTLSEYSAYLKEGDMVLVKGTLSLREDEEPKIILNSVMPLSDALSQTEDRVLYIRLDTNSEDTLQRVKTALMPFSGQIEVRLYFMDTKKVARVPEHLYFDGSQNGIEALVNEFGESNVAFKKQS